MVRSEVREWLSKSEKDFDEARFLFNNDRNEIEKSLESTQAFIDILKRLVSWHTITSEFGVPIAYGQK